MPSFGRWGYNPTRYGLVPDSAVAVDLALGDIVLSTALQAVRGGDWKGMDGATAFRTLRQRAFESARKTAV
jgi:hypothetical protein